MSSKNNETAPQTAGFKKEIGVFGGISIIGGIMIGSGIFYLGSYVLERTGMSMGLALLCWVIGGLVSILRRAVLCRAWSLRLQSGRNGRLYEQSIPSVCRIFLRIHQLGYQRVRFYSGSGYSAAYGFSQLFPLIGYGD